VVHARQPARRRRGEVRRRLLSGGLFVANAPRTWDRIANYIQKAEVETQVRCVDQVGWHGDAFVLPDVTILAPGAEQVVYQTDAEPDHRLAIRGTADEWREYVGALCAGNCRLILAVSCAFAAPLLRILGGESGGVHLIGASSLGKSTTQYVAGSVSGGGTDGYRETWRTTINGLEATACAHNDLLLVLDEIAECEPKDVAQAAYMLSNNMGKGRMSRAIGRRRRLEWRLLFLSSGELTLADHSASAGKRTRGGLEVRLLNIGADMGLKDASGADKGIFQDLHGCPSAKAFAELLKERSFLYYGAPIRTFLAHVVEHRAKILTKWPAYQAEFLAEFLPEDAAGEAKRAAGRLALIAYAGEIATHWNITGWEPDEPKRAAASALLNWLDTRGGAVRRADDEAAIRQVRLRLEADGNARFEPAERRVNIRTGDETAEKIYSRLGYREPGTDGEYWILRESFRKEVCAGFDYRAVCRALDARGYLNRDERTLMHKTRVHDHEGPIWVYAVRASILASDGPEETEL
jgi:putative DNA primase/helicase